MFLLVTIGIIAFFVSQVNRPISQLFRFSVSTVGDGLGTSYQTGEVSKDSWQVWVEKQTAETLENLIAAHKKKARSTLGESEIAEWRTDIHAHMTKHADVVKEKYASPAAMEANGDGLSTEVTVTVEDVPSERYTGPQTLEAVMEAFDEKYDRPNLTRMDERYPRAEWLAMLLDKGVMFGDYGDYSLFMNDRGNLVNFEENGDWRQWRGETFDDWETFEEFYIDRTIWEEQQIAAARQSDPSVFGGVFVGPDKQTYLPGRANRVYVQREGRSASFQGAPLTQKQEWDIMLQGKHPEGYEIIYLDEDGTILSEPPPPIPPPTGEERRQLEAWLKRGSSQQPSGVPGQTFEDGDYWGNGGQDSSLADETARTAAQTAQERFEEAQAKALDRVTTNDTEIGAELEKQLAPEGIEAELTEGLSADRFDKVQQLIDEYGREEGLRRLRESDPDVARRFERRQRPAAPSADAYSDEQPPVEKSRPVGDGSR